MSSLRPLIGCTTYKKYTDQSTQIEIYGVMPSYIEAIVAAGGLPIMIPLGLSEGDLTAIFDRIDGLLLPGGGDVAPQNYKGNANHPTLRDINPDRDRVEIFMARKALQEEKPLLAICRGHQLFNVALGGTLWEDIGSQLPDAIQHDYYIPGLPRNHIPHHVAITPHSRLAQFLGTDVGVNSLHHQAVREVASELTTTAYSPDGVVEATEATGHPFALSVQWHPENLIQDDTKMLSLFQGLVEACQVRYGLAANSHHT